MGLHRTGSELSDLPEGLAESPAVSGPSLSERPGRILRLVRRLKRSHRRNILNFYRLGKLMHYVSDAFTYSHNPGFGGQIKGHHYYEKNLADCFRSQPFRDAALPKGKSDSAERIFLDAHRQYTETAAGLSTDLDYILKVTGSVFRLLVPETKTVKSRKLLLSGLYGILRSNDRERDDIPAYSQSPMAG